MDATVAVHTKGFGSLFQAVKKASMAAWRSSTLRNTPRRIALSSRAPNQRSTRFNQLELVGTKCSTNRGWRLSQARTFGVFVSPVVVQDQVQRDFTWKLLIQSAQEA